MPYVIPVRQTEVLPSASFRFRLTADTLAVQLTVPTTKACSGLSPPSYRLCRAHTLRPAGTQAVFYSHCIPIESPCIIAL